MRSALYPWRALLLPLALLMQLASARADEPVLFKSAQYLLGALQQRLARERGEPAAVPVTDTITGYLSKPPGEGPFPAIVHLHGCGGLSAGRRVRDAGQFTDWGYVTLIVDSFTSRGIHDACASDNNPPRYADAVGALIYLSTLPFVDPKRIAVIGYSQGGGAALTIASRPPDTMFDMPAGLSFTAAVAYYPWCSSASNRLTIPTLVLIGELDDWSLAASCDRLLKRYDRGSAPLKVVVYPEVFHSFDNPDIRGMTRYYGHWLRYDADATRQASEETRGFLATELAKQP